MALFGVLGVEVFEAYLVIFLDEHSKFHSLLQGMGWIHQSEDEAYEHPTSPLLLNVQEVLDRSDQTSLQLAAPVDYESHPTSLTKKLKARN